MGLLRDLTDPLGTLAVAGMLVGVLLGWSTAALMLCAAAAVFSRQQNALLVGLINGLINQLFATVICPTLEQLHLGSCT